MAETAFMKNRRARVISFRHVKNIESAFLKWVQEIAQYRNIKAKIRPIFF